MSFHVRPVANGAGMTPRRDVSPFDVLLAVAWCAVGLLQVGFPRAGLWEDTGSGSYRGANVAAAFLTFAVCVPLVVRRRFPISAFLVGIASLAAMVFADYLVGLLPFVCWMLIYSVGARASTRGCVVAFVAAVTAIWLAWFSGYPGFDANSMIRNIAFFGVCLLAGRFVASNRRNAATLVELAEQRSVASAQQARSAVVEERLRLAQELHDIVAHSMSVISVQAAVGSAAFDTQPHQTRRALTNIERTSSETLRELRGLVGVLRQDDGSRAPFAPSPSLRDVDNLIGNVEAAGVATTLLTSGPFQLPASVDAFAYRIVQEALTNVLKHADATTVIIELHDSGSVVTVQVSDNGRPRPASTPNTSGGHGIVGMRERVATFGGTLRAGPTDNDGFEVTATLPYLAPFDGPDPSEPVPYPRVAS